MEVVDDRKRSYFSQNQSNENDFVCVISPLPSLQSILSPYDFTMIYYDMIYNCHLFTTISLPYKTHIYRTFFNLAGVGVAVKLHGRAFHLCGAGCDQEHWA